MGGAGRADGSGRRRNRIVVLGWLGAALVLGTSTAAARSNSPEPLVRLGSAPHSATRAQDDEQLQLELNGATSFPLDRLSSSSAGTSSESGWRRYRGTITSTVDYFDYCSSTFDRQALGERTWTMAVDVYVGARQTDGDVVEQNPYSFSLYSEQGYEGAITLASARVFTTPQTARKVLLTYWSLRSSGDQVSGRLVDSHKDEAAVLNILSTSSPLVPCRANLGTIPRELTIQEGATLTGSISSSRISLEVVGVSYDETREFVAVVDAKRA